MPPRYQLKEHKGGWHEYSENPIADYACHSPWGYGFPCKCKAGDLLWVRETWCTIDCPHYEPYDCHRFPYMYRADEHAEQEAIKWKPSIFMPRKAARLFLEVKSVRVERIQNISPEDAVSEGAVKRPHYIRYGGEPCLAIHKRYREEFAELWDGLNAKCGSSWDSNPWVWVYEFMRVRR